MPMDRSDELEVDGKRVRAHLDCSAPRCVQAFIVRATQPVGCVRALGEAKVAQQGTVWEAKVARLGGFGDPRARACMHWVSDMYGHESRFWHCAERGRRRVRGPPVSPL